MTGWCIFLAVCCTVGATNSRATAMAAVWLAAAVGFALVGAVG